MKTRIHKLFQSLLDSVAAEPEAVIGFSQAAPPRLGDFMPDLDPELSLDWNGRDFRGLPELRAHILRQAGLEGVCALQDVLVTAGAAEANYLAIRQLVSRGDRVVTEGPGWPQVGVLTDAIGADLVTVRRRDAEGWRLPLDALRTAATPDTRLIFLSNPNNPTGRVFTPEELAEIVDIARACGAWLLIDEVYAGLEWEGPRAASIAGIYEKGITTGSVSKALGLQGLRTGWLICRDEAMVMDAVILRENSSEIMNILGEVVAEIALRPERYSQAIGRARADGQRHLAALDAFVSGQPGLGWHRPQAGLIGLGRLETGGDGDAFADRLLRPPYRTFILPGSAYGEPRHVRLGVGGGVETRHEDGLGRMASLLADWGRGAGSPC
jgi:aspartate/methionine/tyrosine aminotransferase